MPDDWQKPTPAKPYIWSAEDLESPTSFNSAADLETPETHVQSPQQPNVNVGSLFEPSQPIAASQPLKTRFNHQVRLAVKMLALFLMIIGVYTLVLNRQNHQGNKTPTQLASNISDLGASGIDPNARLTVNVSTDFQKDVTIKGKLIVGDGLAVSGDTTIAGDLTVSGSINGTPIQALLAAADTTPVDVSNLNANDITQGTLDDTRLSGNVALLDTDQTFSGANVFSQTLNLNASLTLQPTGVVFANNLSQTGSGNDVNISADIDEIVFTAGGRTFVFPTVGPTNQEICTTSVTCSAPGGTAVQLAPTSAQLDTFAEDSIFIDDSGGGNLLHLQSGSSDQFVVANNGDTTVSGAFTATGNNTIQGGLQTIGTTSQAGSVVLHDGSGQTATIQTTNLSGSRTFTLPDTSGTFCTDAGNCIGGSTGAPNSAAYLTVGNNATLTGERAIAVNVTNLSFTDGGANGSYTINTIQGIATTSSPTFAGLTISGLGTGVVHSGNGSLSSSDVILGSETSGNFVATLGSLTGLSTTGNTGEGSTPTLSVLYGSIASTAVQGNTSLTCGSGTGNLTGGGTSITLGTGGTCSAISTIANPVFSTSVATPLALLGTASTTTGQARFFNAGSAFAGTLQVASLGQATTYSLPDPGAGSASICLSTGNCAGAGDGITGFGTADQLTKFGPAGDTIEDSTISDDGSTVTTSVDLIVQGGGLTIGTALQDAALTLYGNGFTADIDATALTGNQTYNLPDGSGEFCILELANCAGSAGGNAPNDAQYLVLSLDGGLSAERTLSFNGTNFSVVDNGANNSYTVNTAQNINTTATPTFGGLTLTGNLVLNANTIQGTTAIIDFTNFDVASNGNVTAGTYNGQTISSSANFTGSLTVAGLTTLNDSIVLGSDVTTKTLTFGGTIQGTSPFIFEGSSADANELTISIADPSADRTYTIPNSSASSDTFCLLTLANCAGSPSTLQTTYGANADGSDATISLTSSDDSIVISNPASSGSDSSFVLKVEQLNTTGPVDTLVVNNLGTGTILNLQDNSTSVFSVADGGTVTSRTILPETDDTYDLGSNSLRWRDLYLAGDTMHIGTSTSDETLMSYNTTTNSFVVKPATGNDSTSAVQFQNAAGLSVLNLNTASNAATLTLGRIASSGTTPQGKLTLSDGTTDNFGATIQSSTLTANHVYSLPNTDGNFVLTVGSGVSGGTQTFSATGAQQTFVVPAGITSLTIELGGAAGASIGSGTGGSGQVITATISVTPGETLYLYVGGIGSGTSGGFNGGGNGSTVCCGNAGRGGGGGTDIRQSGTALANRIAIAGGGGGAGGSDANGTGANGGSGGGPNGTNGSSSQGSGGTGGTTSAGGTTGGALGTGGNGNGGGAVGGGGGGGGYYGGGGGDGAGCTVCGGGGGGGGGSSLLPAGGSYGGATNTSNGYATLRWFGSGTSGTLPVFGSNNTIADSAITQASGNIGIGDSTPTALLTVGSGDLFQVNGNGSLTIAQAAVSGGQTALKVTPGAHTAVTGEVNDFWIAGHTQTITGGYSTQRFSLFSQPTITAGSALTVTDSATVAIAGAPIKAGSALLTNTSALLIQAGAVSTATNSYGLYVNAQTGATNNYAAIFQGGAVGIGTTSPSSRLTVKDSGYRGGIVLEANGSTVDRGFLYVGDGTNSTVADELYFDGVNTKINLRTGASGTTTALTIKEDATVGIGDTTPDAKLDVEPTGAVTATSYAQQINNLQTNVTTDAIDKYGLYISSTGSFTGSAGTATNNYGLYVATPTGGDNNYAAIFQGGNVGIGTTTPVAKLDVLSATATAPNWNLLPATVEKPAIAAIGKNIGLLVTVTSTNNMLCDGNATTYIGAVINGNGDACTGNSVLNQYIGTLTTQAYQNVSGKTATALIARLTSNRTQSGTYNIARFYDGPTEVASIGNNVDTDPFLVPVANFVIQKTTGNVGIGTTGPTSQLHVYKNSATSSEILVENDHTSGNANLLLDAPTSGAARPAILMYDAGTVKGVVALERVTSPILGAAQNDMLIFSQSANALILGTNAAERMRITSTGNVGIGTTSITEKLEVNGNITPDTASGSDLGTASLEWDELYVGDNNGIRLGADQDATLAYDEATDDRTELTGSGASLFIEDRLSLGTDARTIADSGDGSTATLTLTPTSSFVRLTCNDTDGCDITMGEGSAKDGDILIITNATTNNVNFADTAGVSELANTFAAGQYDNLTLIYNSDHWEELSRSNN